MELSFRLAGCKALFPGFEDADTRAQVRAGKAPSDNAPLPRPLHIPMLTARRLTGGDRLALETALSLMETAAPEAIVFASRHSESERNFRILSALSQDAGVSPTDFTFSVHNSAAGNLTILKKLSVPTTALAAGQATLAALFTESALLLRDYTRVLALDYEGSIPEFFRPHLEPGAYTFPYTTGFLLEHGDSFKVEIAYLLPQGSLSAEVSVLPPSLQLWGALERQETHCTLNTPEATLNCSLREGTC